MTQTTLSFDDNRERQRVRSKLEPAIVEFFHRPTPRFHMDELLVYVRRTVPEAAPDSPSRIMRLLRQEKRINYRVINRAESLYEILPVLAGATR